MAYSALNDLLIGDVAAGTNLNLQAFVQAAADEIDAKLGYRYLVPLDQNAIAPYAWASVKQCANKIASGRALMAMNASGEHTSLHAYGAALLKEGMGMLECMSSGDIPLPGALPVANPPSADGDAPTILVYDQYSAVDTFYDYVMHPPLAPIPTPYFTPYWRPGQYGGFGPPSGPQDPGPPSRHTIPPPTQPSQ
jgi:hypothetical protein